jgi:hypothetical protein
MRNKSRISVPGDFEPFKLGFMKKALAALILALSLLGSVAVHADPPGPCCPPICDPPGGNSGN